MYATTLETEHNPQVNRGPVWFACSTISTNQVAPEKKTGTVNHTLQNADLVCELTRSHASSPGLLH